MKKVEVITLEDQQIFELVQIVFDSDESAALSFLKEHIYNPLQKRKEARCKSKLD
jgi:hypothetical protein